MLPGVDARELRELIDKRYQDRLDMVGRGEALWDYRISIVGIQRNCPHSLPHPPAAEESPRATHGHGQPIG